MQPEPVAENLLKLTRLRAVNAYLVREDDGFTLVDTLIGGSADRLIEAARGAGGEIRRITITHCHNDHVGSLDALRERLGRSVEISIPELDWQLVSGEKQLERKPPGGWPKLATAPDVRLRAGDRVGSLEVVPAPGHSPGHVAFLDTRDRALIAGDVFVTIGGLAVTNHLHVRFPFAYLATYDRDEDLRSAQALHALSPSVLVVGHGGAVVDPEPAMARAIAAAGG